MELPTINSAERNLLSRAHGKQKARCFTGEPITGWGELPKAAHDFAQVLSDIRDADEAEERAIERRREIMEEEHADYLRDLQREARERGE